MDETKQNSQEVLGLKSNEIQEKDLGAVGGGTSKGVVIGASGLSDKIRAEGGAKLQTIIPRDNNMANWVVGERMVEHDNARRRVAEEILRHSGFYDCEYPELLLFRE